VPLSKRSALRKSSGPVVGIYRFQDFDTVLEGGRLITGQLLVLDGGVHLTVRSPLDAGSTGDAAGPRKRSGLVSCEDTCVLPAGGSTAATPLQSKNNSR